MGIISTIKKIVARQTKPLIPLLNEWNNLFCSLTDKLNPLSPDSEKKFLSIGSRLQDFTVRARELSEMSASVARLTSGEEISAAIEGLRKQLNEMIHYLDSGEKEAANSIQKLREIGGIAEGLDSICSEFKKIARSLRFLCISIQIESARFNQSNTGFDILSDNVRKLANLIDTKATSIMKDKELLAILVKDALSRTQELLKLQQGSALKMLRETQESFESLTGLNKKSAEVSHRIATRSSGVYKSIGEMVTSMQFHDITRQEMEHVGKALSQLREELEDAVRDARRLTTSQQKDFAGLTGSVCGVQATRLFRTNETLVKAVERIIDNLRQIAKGVKEMVIETHALSGSSHQSGASLLSRVEHGILAVIQSLGENVKRANEISASVGNAVNGMVEFVREIEDISAEIKLIALNAQVKANLAGEEGKTLGIIAEEVQILAVDARSHTAEVLKRLKTIANEAGVTRANTNSSSDNAVNEVEDMVSMLTGLLNPLERINTEFIALLSRITESGQALGDEIETLSNQIAFHKDISETIDDIVEKLTEIVAHAQQLVPSLNIYSRADNTQLPANSGATDTEMEFSHCSTAVMATGTVTGNDNKSKNNDAVSVLGDNVELF